MDLNRIGKNVRKATGGVSSKIFGMMKTSRSQYSATLRKVGLSENFCSHGKAKKILREIEFKKTRAIEFVRRFQNC